MLNVGTIHCLRRRDTKWIDLSAYGTSRPKSPVCVVTLYTLLKTATLKSNKRQMPLDNPSRGISSHFW